MRDWLLTLLTQPDAFPAAKAADFWFGALGFVITIVGFALAWLKLSRVQEASKAAEKALNDFRFRVQRYEATSDISVARYALNTILKTADVNIPKDMADLLSDISQAIGRIMPVVSASNGELGKALAKTKTSIERTIGRIEDASYNDGVGVNAANLRKLARNALDILHTSHQLLQERSL